MATVSTVSHPTGAVTGDTRNRTSFSVVIPVFMSEASIPALVDALSGISSRLPSPVEAVFVVDGSPDRSFEVLRTLLSKAPFSSKVVVLSRNFGAFAAIRAGLAEASGDYLAVMAADLQEPPELLIEFLHRLQTGDCDVVIGVRQGRSDPRMQRLTSALFWWAYRRLVMPEMPRGGVDVFACTSAARDQLLALQESRSSLIAQIFWLGLRRGEVKYHRGSRHSGKSAWTLKKRVAYLRDSIFAFTDLPIRALSTLGFLGLVGSLIFGAVVVVGRTLGWVVVPGYTATVALILTFGSLNLLGLGVVGSYAWRAFENTKARPSHVVLLRETFGGSDDSRGER